MELSVIIPFYNEEKTLETILTKIKNLDSFEIIAIDDGSTDQSFEIASRCLRKNKDQLIKLDRNFGKGRAIKEGIKLARGEWIVIQDADLEYFPEDYTLMLENTKDHDLIVGNRFNDKNKNKFFYPIHYFANLLISKLLSCSMKIKISDAECGLKLIRKSLITDEVLTRNDFGIEIELMTKLLKKGARFKEVPIHYEPRTYKQGKKIKFKDGIIALYLIFLYH